MSPRHSDQTSQRSVSVLDHSVGLWRLWLLVRSDQGTKGQCHLLSCSGQLKRWPKGVGWQRNFGRTHPRLRNEFFFQTKHWQVRLTVHPNLWVYQQYDRHNSDREARQLKGAKPRLVEGRKVQENPMEIHFRWNRWWWYIYHIHICIMVETMMIMYNGGVYAGHQSFSFHQPFLH